MKKISIINGPNLNMLGTREPETYGNLTLKDINFQISELCHKLNLAVDFYQDNSEGEIINLLQELNDTADLIIINPGAYTHTSIAIYDAIKSIKVPVIEVHLSNIYNREEFRKKSVIAGACTGQIMGFGYKSYLIAIEAANKILR